MENQNDEQISESSTEEVVESEDSQEELEDESVSEDAKTPTPSAPKTEDKSVPYDRFKKVNDELKRLKTNPPKSPRPLDVDDYLEISSSLNGLDRQEQEWLAEEHKTTGKAMSEIRKSEKFMLLQSAYRDKVEKEKAALRPSGKQSESDRPKSIAEQLAGADLKGKEEMLTKLGLYRNPKANNAPRVLEK